MSQQQHMHQNTDVRHCGGPHGHHKDTEKGRRRGGRGLGARRICRLCSRPYGIHILGQSVTPRTHTAAYCGQDGELTLSVNSHRGIPSRFAAFAQKIPTSFTSSLL